MNARNRTEHPARPRSEHPSAATRPTGGKVITNPGRADLSEWGIGVKSTDQPDFSGVATGEGNADVLSMLPTMVATLREKIRRAEETAAAAKRAADDLAFFQGVTLPEAMELAGVQEYTLTDGAKLKVKPDLKASITEANRPEAFEWMREHDHGGAIKTYFDVDVRALTEKQRATLLNMISKRGVAVDVKETVHPATLKSLVKELLEQGTVLPPCFSIFEFKKAEIKEAKG